MYNEQLEQLIDAALEDGVLTEKEKQILFKKAQAMGVDLDEFEMVLDARLVKLQKAEKEKAASSAPKSNKLGDVKKCPACGAMVQSYQGTCPECGYAFEGIDANSAVKELSNLLQKTNGKDEMEKTIDNFPIPMEKASLLAFVTWLRPQSIDSGNPLANSYQKKYSECINKIKVSFSSDKDLQQFLKYYDEDSKFIKKQKLVKFTIKNKWFWIGVILVISLISCFLPKPRSKSLEKTDAAMIEAIEQGDLNKAEQIYINFKYKDFYGYRSKGRAALGKAFIEREQLEKAELYADEEDLFEMHLNKKEYDKADKYKGSITDDGVEKIIKAMCENGEKKRAKQYLISKQAEIKNAASYEGYEKKCNERINQINRMINSY